MKKLSLIIPVYNAEEYLIQCLNSALGQTYANMEILCIDDGSTDKSGLILDDYAKKYNQLHVLHQTNHGESHARNQGLLHSTGEYIAFMDCDDWIDPEMYQILIDCLEQNDVDMVVSAWIKEGLSTSQYMTNRGSVRDGDISQRDMMLYIYKRDLYQAFAYLWNKLFKRETLLDSDKNLLMFDENLKLGGDVLYLANSLLNIEKAWYVDKAFYHYRQRGNSGCHEENVSKRLDWLQSYLMTIDLFEKNNVSEDILIWVKRFLAYHSSNTAEISYKQKNKAALEKSIDLMNKYRYEYEITNQQHLDRLQRFTQILKYKL